MTCSRCDYTTYAEKSALGHDKVDHEAQAPTCTEIGWDAYVTCSRCDYTTYVEKSALGHDKVDHEAKAPTCTEIGWDAYETCSRCDYTTYEEIPAAGHNPGTPVKENEIPATTMTPGSYELVVYCTDCGIELEYHNVTVGTKIEKSEFTEETVPEQIKEVIEDVIKNIVESNPDSELQNMTVVEQLQSIMSEQVNKSEIIQQIVEQNAHVESVKDVEHELIDVQLQYSNDGGETWVDADEEHFPEDGKLQIVLEVPAGTDIRTHTYVVAHMFSSDAFGMAAGTIEYPEVTAYINPNDGKQYISFYVTGLSPITISYVETDPCGAGHDFENGECKDCEALCGDLNADGKRSIADVVLLNAYVKGIVQLSDAQIAVCDVDGNGIVVEADVTALQALILGKTVTTP